MTHSAASGIRPFGSTGFHARRLLLAGAISILAGCAAATEPVHSAASAPNPSSMNSIELTAWTTPQILQVDQSAVLQVSLHPAAKIGKAVLSATSNDARMTISPNRYLLENLAPEEPGGLPTLSPPNPPALGMTVQRNFKIQASKPGNYRLMVTIEYDGARQDRELEVRVQ